MGIQFHTLRPGKVFPIIELTRHEYRIVVDSQFFNTFVQADIGLKETNSVLLGIETLDLPVRNLDPFIQKLRISILWVHVGDDIVGLDKTRISFHPDNPAVII